MAGRFYIEGPLQLGMLDIPAAVAQHMKAVRLRVGDSCEIFNGGGGVYQATVCATDKRAYQCELTHFNETSVESSLSIHLVQVVSRGQRMDFTLQKATELGVTAVTPVVSERVQGGMAQASEKRMAHWQGVLVSAAEQCGRDRLPVLHAPMMLHDWLQRSDTPGLKLCLQPDSTQHLKHLPRADSVFLLIGSEGGFSPAELAAIKGAGWQGCALGPRILRTETAALTTIAILQSQWGDL